MYNQVFRADWNNCGAVSCKVIGQQLKNDVSLHKKNRIMTLVAAWIRRIKGVEELVIASDSRLRFGCEWDYCPKIFPLQRGDAVLCFAGDTFYAYPMLLQLQTALEMNVKFRSRAIDISDLRSYVIAIIEQMRDSVMDYANGTSKETETGYRFILAGYSWKLQKYKIWHIQYQQNINKFSYRSVGLYPKKHAKGREYIFIGDKISNARKMLNKLIEKSSLKYGELDWEPLEVLRDICKSAKFNMIGGTPQVVKVYRHLNSTQCNVIWSEDTNNNVYLGGRKLLDFEKNEYQTLNLENFKYKRS